MASFAAAPSFLQRTVLAQTPVGKDSPILIAIFQRGAIDGISMVVPFGDKSYYSVRPNIAVPAPKTGNPDASLDLDGYFALHPALAPFKPIYNGGHLAVVHAVGSPDNTRSHFDAQDYMEAGTPGSKRTADGWLNRYMQSRKDAKATAVPRSLPHREHAANVCSGPAPSIAMTNIADFGVRGGQGSGSGRKASRSSFAQNTDMHCTARQRSVRSGQDAEERQTRSSTRPQTVLTILDRRSATLCSRSLS